MKIEYILASQSSAYDTRSLIVSPTGRTQLTELLQIINPATLPVTQETLTRFFIHDGFCAYGILGDGQIVGVATLILCYKVNGHSARLEHLSVRPQFYRQGIARGLVMMLLGEAKSLNMQHVDLTCESRRKAANNLYASLGFEIRETNPRRLVLPVRCK